MKEYNISVIVPTYKPENYIWECLDSLSSQSLSRDLFEIIVVLNGPKEPYYSQIQDYIYQHLNGYNSLLLYNEKPGVSAARNMAIDCSKGEYICFIDDDDYISSCYLEELYKHASIDTIPVCRPISFLGSTCVYSDYNITKDYDHYHSRIKVPFYRPRRFFNGPVYKLIHHSIIADRRFDERFKNGEDSLFMFLISDRIKYVEFADETAVYYRRVRPNSATQKKKPFGYGVKNYSKLMMIQTIIYFKGFPRYNFRFYMQSLVGRVKSIIFD